MTDLPSIMISLLEDDLRFSATEKVIIHSETAAHQIWSLLTAIGGCNRMIFELPTAPTPDQIIYTVHKDGDHLKIEMEIMKAENE